MLGAACGIAMLLQYRSRNDRSGLLLLLLWCALATALSRYLAVTAVHDHFMIQALNHDLRG